MNEKTTASNSPKLKKHIKRIIVAFIAALFLTIGGKFVFGEELAASAGLFLGNIKNAAGSLIENLTGAGRNTFLGQKNPKLVEEILIENGSRENTAVLFGEKKETACAFETLQHPSRDKIILNEIAWMGTGENTNDEWIEIKNISGETVDISGWQLIDKDEQIKIIFAGEKFLRQNDILLLARKQKNEKNREADLLYDGGLKNSNEGVRIFNSNCELQDEAVSSKWPAGDNKTKKTMERDLSGFGWHASQIQGGTPGKENTKTIAVNTSSIRQNKTEPETTVDNRPAVENINQENKITKIIITTPIATTTNTEQPQQKEQERVLISEIFVGSEENSKNEFVEIYNPTSAQISLSGWVIKKKSSTGKETTLVSTARLEGKIIPSRGYFLLANEEGYSGMATPDVFWPQSYTLAYTNNSVLIYNTNGSLADEINWSEIPKGQSFERVSWENNQFTVQPSPNPKNSGGAML